MLASVSAVEELGHILDQHPAYVIRYREESDPHYAADASLFFQALNLRLGRDYKLEQSIEGIDIYAPNVSARASLAR
jgi:hypothetical protein